MDAPRISAPAHHLRLPLLPPDTRLAELDRLSLQGFVTWLAAYRGERGRLPDRSSANVLVPLRPCLADAEREGLVFGGLAKALLLPRRRGGNGWHFEQGASCLWISRGLVGAPKSRFGLRCVPLDAGLAARLTGRGKPGTVEEDLIFPNGRGTPLDTDNIRFRVLMPAVARAGLSGIGFHAFRHSCASMLIERGLSSAPAVLDGAPLGRLHP